MIRRLESKSQEEYEETRTFSLQKRDRWGSTGNALPGRCPGEAQGPFPSRPARRAGHRGVDWDLFTMRGGAAGFSFAWVGCLPEAGGGTGWPAGPAGSTNSIWEASEGDCVPGQPTGIWPCFLFLSFSGREEQDPQWGAKGLLGQSSNGGMELPGGPQPPMQQHQGGPVPARNPPESARQALGNPSQCPPTF